MYQGGNAPETERNPKMSTQPQTIAATSTCLCGCGQATSPKANYRPGHDAAHVSNLLATIVNHGDFSQEAVAEYAKALPSMPLRQKLEHAVNNYAERQADKSNRPSRQSRTEWVDCDTHDYKIGRWVYPVQVEMYRRGLEPGQELEYLDFRRNTKRDGSGEWIELEGGELIRR